MKPAVLSLCDFTGNMVKPWAEAGFDCYCVDLQHSGRLVDLAPGITGIGCDVMEFDSGQFIPTPYIAFAFPPCTHLAGSGARWWKDKGLSALIESLTLVERCREICESLGCPWMLENPIGALATHWRKPDHKFDPCDYGGYLDPEGDAYTKRTCLWTGGGFVMPEPRPVFPIDGSKMHRIGPSSRRANLRSETPMGFARAVFEANRERAEVAA